MDGQILRVWITRGSSTNAYRVQYLLRNGALIEVQAIYNILSTTVTILSVRQISGPSTDLTRPLPSTNLTIVNTTNTTTINTTTITSTVYVPIFDYINDVMVIRVDQIIRRNYPDLGGAQIIAVWARRDTDGSILYRVQYRLIDGRVVEIIARYSPATNFIVVIIRQNITGGTITNTTVINTTVVNTTTTNTTIPPITTPNITLPNITIPTVPTIPTTPITDGTLIPIFNFTSII